jgi:hypothetical protein
MRSRAREPRVLQLIVLCSKNKSCKTLNPLAYQETALSQQGLSCFSLIFPSRSTTSANEARVVASYPALRGFSPVAFAQVNFPTRVADESELRRYADIMYEVLGRDEWLNSKLYSRDEAKAIRQLSTQIETLTGGAVQQSGATADVSVRFVSADAHGRAPSGRSRPALDRVRDRIGIGPSCRVPDQCGPSPDRHGQLPVTLSVAESAAWRGQRRSRRMGVRRCADLSGAPRSARAGHAHSWLHFARLHELPSLPVSADVVICDAAIGEMDHFAFRYIARIASLLAVKSDIGCFLFQNLGEERIHQCPTQ